MAHDKKTDSPPDASPGSPETFCKPSDLNGTRPPLAGTSTRPSIDENRFEIRTPNKLFSSVRNGVKFTDGVGLTGNAELVGYFRDLGYTVIDREAKGQKAKK